MKKFLFPAVAALSVSAALAQTLAAQVGEDHEAPLHDSLSDR